MQQEFSSDSGAGSRVLPRIGLQPSPRARSLSPRSHQVLQQEGGSAIPPVSRPLGPAGRGSGRPVGAEATKWSQLSDIVLENTQLKQKVGLVVGGLAEVMAVVGVWKQKFRNRKMPASSISLSYSFI